MKVKARILNHGTYDGMKHIKFPVDVVGERIGFLGYVNVPMSELLRIGYDIEAGSIGELPDQLDMAESLPFMISWGEIEVIEEIK